MVTSTQALAVQQLLEGKKNILILTHIAPDGDALGSSLGLQFWLQDTYPQIENIHVAAPTAFPHFLAWMPGAQNVLNYDTQSTDIQRLAETADLVFCCDFNEPKRIGNMAAILASTNCPKIMLDHHLNPDVTMVDLVISYPEAPAAAYVVLDLINHFPSNNAIPSTPSASPSNSAIPSTPSASPSNSAILPMKSAICIYTGLMTDTGNFAFNSNNPQLYEMVAQLLRAGINKDVIFDNVFNQFSVDRLRFTGYCLYHKMRIFPKYHAALIALSAEELRRFNFQSGDAEGIVNMPLQIASVKYSVFMREDVDKIKISFRSQGDRPVNIFAKEIFNGGGHKNAAGGENHLSLNETVKLFEDNYQKYFSKD